ncbi:MAG: TetR/AcrR family transcriptional regulator [Desulfobacterales bacterium]|nr:TetR/AcrR family transcriptional regulator [Desulfobacterales bacterium]
MAEAVQPVRKPRQKRGIETRQRIIDAAQALFSRKGYHATNSKEIAAEAGVAIGSFYAYFKDKKQLFLEVLKRHIEATKAMIMTRMQEIDFSSESVNEAIYLLIKALYKAHDLSPDFHREAEAMRYSDPEVAQLHDVFHESFRTDFAALLDSFKARLRVTDIEAAAHIVMAASEEIVHSTKIFGETQIEEDRLLSGLADMICRYLFK